MVIKKMKRILMNSNNNKITNDISVYQYINIYMN